MIIFLRLGLGVAPLLGAGVALAPGILDGQLLLLHLLLLLRDGFLQVVHVQRKQDISLLHLLSFVDLDAANPKARHGSHCQFLVLNCFPTDLDPVGNSAIAGNSRCNHCDAVLIKGPGQQGKANHGGEENAGPFPKAPRSIL